MKHTQIEKLVRVVAPLKRAKNKGSQRMWETIKEQARLPDWVFPFFNTYGSGVFAGFDKDGGFLDYLEVIEVMNVFEKPFLHRHRALGEAFSLSNQISRLSVSFFPEKDDGLFPILATDQAMFLLIDPKDASKVYTTDNHLVYFRERGLNYIDYLLLLFDGKKSELWSIPKQATVSTVGFFLGERAAAPTGRAIYPD